MTKLETVRNLNDSGPQLQIVESVRTLQESVSLMREDLRRLPGAISTETAQALEPLDRMARALDQGLDTHLAIIQPLIDQATSEMQQRIERLAHDRVQRSVRMALEQHRKAMKMSRSAEGWMKEAKGLRVQKAELQGQIQSLRLRFWTATGIASSLAVVLLLMIFARIL